jgi:hypothetical protein
MNVYMCGMYMFAELNWKIAPYSSFTWKPQYVTFMISFKYIISYIYDLDSWTYMHWTRHAYIYSKIICDLLLRLTDAN